MKKPSLKEVIFTSLVIVIITVLIVCFISLYGKTVVCVKNVATETPVVETVNSSIDGTVEAAKCPTCVFGDATLVEGD